ncbi:ATP-binding cassette sub-family C member 5-like isoform X2 [Oppia nitens]|uniref:ATP-binding cassette sub-family C member 5-like isoform X2 n=1 Tax=Oppia nitens TaxID=1686743 RepID=UPI0023DCA9D6|nr:ATP-binding cassette sub-family C member 5-like isoform X2 [Oppia nitens]
MDTHNELKINVNEDDDENIIYKSTTTSSEYIKGKGLKKYRHEFQHLLPFNRKKRDEKDMPVDSASCFSFVFFEWMTPIVWQSFRSGIKSNDIYECSPLDSSRINSFRMSNIWESECRKHGLHNASLQKVIQRFIKTRLLFSSLFYLICLLLGYLSSTLFLKKLLDSIENESESGSQAIKWTIALFVSELGRATSFAIMYAICIRTAIRTTSALNTLLYNKILTSRSTNKTIGEMVNLFAVDINKIFHMIYILPLVLGGPIVTIVTIVYTWSLLGVFAMVGVLVFILIFGLQFLIAKGQSYYRKRVVINSDKRVSYMTELLTYIKLIKLYGWEKTFSQSILEFRKKEKLLLEKCQYLQTISTSLSLMTPLVITVVTIVAYTLSKEGDLTAATAFTLVMVNYVAAHGIRSLPIYLKDIVNGRIAMNRIEKVLQYDDKDNYIRLTTSTDNSVEFNGATLAWDRYCPSAKMNVLNSEQMSSNEISIVQRSSTLTATCLFDLNFEIPNGKHIGIIGSVGSGKTALLHSVLGQMRLISGKVGVRGSVAYVPQDSWILNATVRQNITFGNNFDSKRYYEAVKCCALTHDISSLVAEDQTEIGERGVTLSGGQKQRISLARAYFADKDIYLLDDPLSSVDRNVAQHIFSQCIRNGLKDKTVLIVTQQTYCLEYTDFVVFLKEGRVVNIGVHNHLYNSDYEYKQLIDSSEMSSLNKEIEIIEQKETDLDIDGNDIRFSSPDWSDVKPLSLSENSSESSVSQTNDIDSTETLNSGRLIIDETIGSGNISLETYKGYITAGGGMVIVSFVIVWLTFQAIASSFANWWLGYWISQGSGNTTSIMNGTGGHEIIIDNPNLKFYQTIYGLTIVIILCVTLTLGYMFTKVTLSASNVLHNQLFNKVLRSTMSVFDTVPIGRILNTFTRDMDEVDTQVPQALDGFLQRLMIVVCNLFIIIMVYPWFLIAFTVLIGLFWLIHIMFRGAMRDLKRVENTRRSPIYSHITTTFEGLSTIKAYNKQKQFINKFNQLIDNHSAPNFLYYCSMRWLSTRMDILCVFISLFAALFAINGKGSVGSAFAGLALVLSMQLSGLLQFVIRLGVDVETRFTSVERIHMYIQTLKTEKDVSLESGESVATDWPTRGRISFRNVTMRYRPGLKLVLKDITFDISPQEKIGIVGRTGAGKSSIASVLFRLVEPTSGVINIDGIDISSIPLNILRSRISIIPQDPILFRGSIRKNLDPFNEFNTLAIMEALESVNLSQKINNLKNGINSSVNESGASFSAGERQLLCMTRALLRKSKIIFLDEAMAHMDGETQQIIQNTITQTFKDCTVIMIAHRLATVQHCHRVMVLSDGKIVEFDNPSILAANTDSYYSKMIHQN